MPSYGVDARIKRKARVDQDDLKLSQSDFDTLVSKLNEQASDRVDTYCGRDFTQHDTSTISVVGNGRPRIPLPIYPIRSITEVKEDDNTVDASDYRLAGDQGPFAGSRNSGVLVRVGGVWDQPVKTGDRNIEVTADWGFTNPPDDIVQVVEQLAVDALVAIGQRASTKGASSVSMDGFSVTYGVEAIDRGLMDLSDAQKSSLKPWRRVIVT